MKQSIALVVALATITGCAVSTVDSKPQSYLEAKSTVKRDTFRHTVTVRGAEIVAGFDLGAPSYALVGVKSKDSSSETYLNFWGNSTNWKFWDHAVDEDGVEFAPDRSPTHEVMSGGSVFESILFKIDRAYLEKHAANGVKVRIEGKNAEKVIHVLPNQIGAFLASFDATQAE